MFRTEASYSFFEKKIIPRARFFYISGNKFVEEDITDDHDQLVKAFNREFSTYSPTDSNLADSHYPAFGGGPYVFTGAGLSLNFGILRPNIFYDPVQMTNLVTPNAGVDIKVTEKLSISFDYWYLSAEQAPVGADYDPVAGVYYPRTLSKYLGNELDLYAEYCVNEYITFSLLGGLFLPGDYYREQRGDEDLLCIAAAPRFDGGANDAWVIEAAVTYCF
jgi:hypothetical protein